MLLAFAVGRTGSVGSTGVTVEIVGDVFETKELLSGVDAVVTSLAVLRGSLTVDSGTVVEMVMALLGSL